YKKRSYPHSMRYLSVGVPIKEHVLHCDLKMLTVHILYIWDAFHTTQVVPGAPLSHVTQCREPLKPG
ncbi:Hypothetical protein CINCED_3A021178, partial [Cinara cedri]